MALDYNLKQTGPEVQQILDDAPVTKAELAQEVADRQNAVSAEHDRATEAEQTLAESISAENDRAMEAESALSESISAEHDRATEAESALSESISAEHDRATEAESALNESISAEHDRATEAESALSESISAEHDRATEAESALNESISAEHDRATEAESALSELISAEHDHAAEALSESISAEHDRATEAESALSESISAEHDRATEAESALNESISTEHDRATEAEENLAHEISESISSERERAENVEQELREMIGQGGGTPSQEIIDMINTIAADGSTLSLEMTPKLVFAGEPFRIDLTAKTSEYAKSIRVYHAGYVVGEGIGYELKVVDNVTVPHEGQTKYTSEFTIGGHRKTTTAILEAVRPCFYGAGNNYISATNNMGIKKSPAGFYDVNVSVPGSRIYIVIPSTMTFNRVRMSGVDMPFDAPANVVVGGTAYKAYRSSNTYDIGNLTIEIQ